MVLGYFIFIPYNKVTGSLYLCIMYVCLYQRIDPTAEPICFSYTWKLPIGAKMVLGYFIFIPYNKVTGSFSVCLLSVPKDLANR